MSPKLHSVTADKSAGSSTSISQKEAANSSTLVDDAFDPKRSDSYHLSIEVSASIVSFSILDKLNNKYLALHTESAAGKGTTEGILHLLQMVQSQELLKIKYQSVSLVLVDDKFTTVPTPLFDKSQKDTFLEFNIEGQKENRQDSEVLVDKLRGVEAYNLYPIQKDLLKKLQESLGNLSVIHHTTCLVDTLLSLNKNQNQKTSFLHFQEGLFSFIVIEGNDLRFCNNFLYNSKEDLAYYTLFVCEQLKLNPESLKMVLLGEISRSSAEYEILYTYIKNLGFIERNKGFSYSYKLDSLPGHYHFNLFSQFHCVS